MTALTLLRGIAATVVGIGTRARAGADEVTHSQDTLTLGMTASF